MSFIQQIRRSLFIVSVIAFSPAFAGLNLTAGMTTTASSIGMGGLLGGEMTLNLFNVVEAGVFYDQNITLAKETFNMAGVVGRLGFGPLHGLTFEARAGLAPLSRGIGVGLGFGYRFNNYVAFRVGPRAIIAAGNTNAMLDAGLMLCL